MRGASAQDKPLTQSTGAFHLKAIPVGGLILNVMFSWSFGLKQPVGNQETVFPPVSWNPIKTYKI